MNTKRLSLLPILLILLLAGCSPATPTLPGSTDAPSTAEATPQAETPLATSAPTLTPTPPAPQVILLAPDESADADSAVLLDTVQTALADLAEAEGLSFAVQPALAQEALAGARVVVAMPSVGGVADLASAHPEIQFAALNAAGLQPGANLSLIQDSAYQERLAFGAGYTGALMTADWRVGLLLPAGGADGEALFAAFANGGVFFCGLCTPAYPPYETYPIAATLSEQAGEAEVQAAVDSLVARGVKTVFLAQGVGGEALYKYLAQKEVLVIGSAPPPELLAEGWVVSLQAGWADALTQLWPVLLSGEPGQELHLPVTADHVNPESLSEGRLRLLQELLADLNAGYIDVIAPGP